MARRSPTDEERAELLWSKLDRSGGADACWPFKGLPWYRSAYPAFYWPGFSNAAHRVALFLTAGPPPPARVASSRWYEPVLAGELLQTYREERGVTQRALAAEWRIPVSAVSALERGRKLTAGQRQLAGLIAERSGGRVPVSSWSEPASYAPKAA